jgi:hypothetical protein
VGARATAIRVPAGAQWSSVAEPSTSIAFGFALPSTGAIQMRLGVGFSSYTFAVNPFF